MTAERFIPPALAGTRAPRQRIPPALRDALFALAPEGRCLYCYAAPATTIDHYHPLAWRGIYARSLGNLVPACRECNLAKGESPPDLWVAQHCRKGTAKRIQKFLAAQLALDGPHLPYPSRRQRRRTRLGRDT